MLSQQRVRAMILICTLLFAACAPTAYQHGLAESERLSQVQEQHGQLEQRVTNLERQMASRQAFAPAPTPAPQPTPLTWRQRFDSIPAGSTYTAVEQVVGQPTYIVEEGARAICLYYISDQEIYVLFFESGVYTQGIITDMNRLKFAHSSRRF